MALFKKRPQLQNIDYISPPPTEILHAFADDGVSTEERAAKRRRIVDYAKDYLKGRDVLITSASLKGPFDKGWKNPWRAKPVVQQMENVQTTPEHVNLPVQDEEMEEDEEDEEDREDDEVVGRVMVPETEARPSKAGSDYCHDWLRRQDVQRYSPEVDEGFDVEVREAGEETPSRPQPRGRAARFKLARPNVVPARTADQPAERSILSDMPAPIAQVDSLQVDAGSSAAKRSLSEQPPGRAYRDMFKTRKDTIDDSSFTKVSMIQDDLPLPKPRPVAKLKLKFRDPPADSPGFVFRRVNDGGKRPIRRGSHHSKGSTTQRDDENGQSHAPTSIDNADAQEPAPVDDEVVEDDIEDGSDDVPPENAVIHADDEGRWPCPMQACPKQTDPYLSEGGLRRHLRTKHSVLHITKDKSRALPRKVKQKELETTTAYQRHVPKWVFAPSTNTPDAAQNENRSVEGGEEAHDDLVAEPIIDIPPAPVQSVAQQESEDETSPSTVKAAPPPTEEHPSASKPQPEAQQPESQDSVIQPDQEEDNTIAVPEDEQITIPPPDPNITPALPSDLLVTTTTDTTAPPDRQDSRAFSTFTFNTQAALLQAHQAFQDTQSPLRFSPPLEEAEVETPNHIPGHLANILSAGADDDADDTITPLPFRRPGIPSFFTRSAAAPPSLSKAVPANTQDLVNAAADLSFSTVKKPQPRPLLARPDGMTKGGKKRASFADWTQAKPSQAGPVASLKVVEWSPLGVTPPVALRQKPSSQPVETPLKSALTKKKSNLSFSFSRTPLTSMPTPTPAQNPLSSDLYQAAQREDDMGLVVSGAIDAHGVSLGVGGGGIVQNGGPVGGMNSQDVEHALNEAESFLSTWDFEREVGVGRAVV
jgi:hypothetical protein